MSDPEGPERRTPDTEMKIAAAAITAAISPPLGVAVAAGSALRSRRVREALRKGTVSALAGAMQLGDHFTASVAARSAGQPQSESPAANPAKNRKAPPATP